MLQHEQLQLQSPVRNLLKFLIGLLAGRDDTGQQEQLGARRPVDTVEAFLSFGGTIISRDK